MSGRGRPVFFHGAFKSLAAADRKAESVEGFVQEKTIRGRRRKKGGRGPAHRRYVVMTERRR